MRRRIFLGAGGLAAVGFVVFWWLTIPAVIPAQSLAVYAPNLANGLVVFNAGGCASCHAVPDQPDRLRLGGGLAIPSPFGTFFAPNISPDAADGIGRWSETQFVTAVTKFASVQRPIPSAGSGEMFGAKNVPNGEGIARPPPSLKRSG